MFRVHRLRALISVRSFFILSFTHNCVLLFLTNFYPHFSILLYFALLTCRERDLSLSLSLSLSCTHTHTRVRLVLFLSRSLLPISHVHPLFLAFTFTLVLSFSSLLLALSRPLIAPIHLLPYSQLCRLLHLRHHALFFFVRNQVISAFLLIYFCLSHSVFLTSRSRYLPRCSIPLSVYSFSPFFHQGSFFALLRNSSYHLTIRRCTEHHHHHHHYLNHDHVYHHHAIVSTVAAT